MSMADVLKLARVNDPAANTWNYLRINGTEVAVPAAEGDASELGVVSGLGAEADAWIAAAAEVQRIEVAAGSHEAIEIAVDADAGETAAHALHVGNGAEVDVAVVVSSEAQSAEQAFIAAGDDELAVATAGNESSGVAAASSDAPSTSASLLLVEAEAGAVVRVRELVALDASKQHLEGLGVSAAEGASVEVTQYVLDGGSTLLGTAVALDGAHAKLDLNLHYLVREGETLDANYYVPQAGAATESELAFYGVLGEGSSKTLRDTIDFVQGAVGASGHEKETVLLAGQKLVNKSLPVILCTEEDVDGSHGAAIGAVSPDQAAYLRSRGLSEDDITALFARSVFDGALTSFPEFGHEAAERVARRVLGDTFEG